MITTFTKYVQITGSIHEISQPTISMKAEAQHFVDKIFLNMSSLTDLSALFLDAIMKDYIHVVIPLLITNPELLEYVQSMGAENPLIIACKYGSLRVAEEIAKRKPEFVCAKNHGDGYTPMHFASAKGQVSLIRVLADLKPQVCLVEDNLSMIPLHIAVMNGYMEVIRTLINACPSSLQILTSQHETALHLAMKYQQCGAFEVLIQEIGKFRQEHLLNRKDREGNTILHIATFHKLIWALKLLLPDASTSTSRRVMHVNSMNNKGQTALDIYYDQNCRDMTARKIGHILHEAGAIEGRFLAHPHVSQSPRSVNGRRISMWTLETKNLLLVVLVMIVGTAFTVICNLPHGFMEEKHVATAIFSVKGVTSGQLPTIFYLLVFNTIGVLLSMGIIVTLIWSLPCGRLLLFVVITTFIVYALILGKIMPKFSVRIGSCNISSFGFLWLSALTFIFFGGVITALTKCIFSCLRSKTKTVEQM